MAADGLNPALDLGKIGGFQLKGRKASPHVVGIDFLDQGQVGRLGLAHGCAAHRSCSLRALPAGSLACSVPDLGVLMGSPDPSDITRAL